LRYPRAMPLIHFVCRDLRRFALVLLAAAAPAWADTGNVTPHGFTIIFRDTVKASPTELWQLLVQLPRWWNPQHSYSGVPSNMSLDAQAGGCWCERWGENQSVQHGLVVQALPGRTLRLYANLGPLQELPIQGVLTFTIAMQEQQTVLRVSYRVGGPPDLGLEKLAPLVDQVIGEQFKRLKGLADGGKPQ